MGYIEPILLVYFQSLFLRHHKQLKARKDIFLFSFVSSDSPFMNILQFRDEGGASE